MRPLVEGGLSRAESHSHDAPGVHSADHRLGGSIAVDSREKMAEVARLAAILCDGQMTEAEMAELDALLRDDPAAQSHYRQYISLHVALAWKFVDRPFQPQAEQPRPPVLGFLGDLARWGENLPGMRMFSWLLVGFVGMLVGLPTIAGDRGRRGRFSTGRRRNWSRRRTAAGPTRPRRFPPAANWPPARRSTWRPARRRSSSNAAPSSRFSDRASCEVLSDTSARLLVGKLTAQAETDSATGSPFARRR